MSYSYIFYVYFFTDAADNSQSDYSKCWIPLDCILMALVAMYYFSSKAIEKFTDENGGVEVGEQQPEESLNETQEERQLEVNPEKPTSFL